MCMLISLAFFLFVYQSSATTDDNDYCAAGDETQECFVQITAVNRYLPTESRLKENFVDWQQQYDTTYNGKLTSQQIEDYYVNGFLIVPNVIPENMINDCLSDIDKLIDKIANKLYENSLISNLCSNNDTWTRLTCLDQQHKGAGVLIHKFGELFDSYSRIWGYHKLTDIAAQILQPTLNHNTSIIDANPIWNHRSKLPVDEHSQVPWHQDLAYFSEASWNVHMFTVWIPFLDVDETNGAIQFIRQGHLPGNIATHTCCYGNTWYLDLAEKVIEDEILNFIQSDAGTGTGTNKQIDINDFLEIGTMKKGDVLLFSNLVPHRSLDNFSDKIRWSIDLRYQIHGTPNGFDDLKPNLKLKDINDDDFIPDWSEWKLIDRNRLQHEQANVNYQQDFTSILVGPWMDQWEIVNQNDHTRAYFH